MKRLALTALILAACHKTPAKGGDDGPAPGSDAAVIDAPRGPIDAVVPIGCTPTHGTTITWKKIGTVAGGGAMMVTAPPGDPRLFVVERKGTIHVFDRTGVEAPIFLDLRSASGGPVQAGGPEQGLLGLLFDPAYATNGTFYVYYTADNPGNTTNPYLDVLARYKVSSDPGVADPKSGEIVLAVPDFAANHNGGTIEFGPDGYLYLGIGDGGGGGDPNRNGQNTHALLGKILRLDVRNPPPGKPYGIPADNPFADGQNGAPEVFIYGVRNPWRWAFDRGTGDLWIADVGQSLIEEVDVLPAGKQAGANLGWSMYEGSSCFGNYTCDPAGKVMPLDERKHSDGWAAIIGGDVYRGACFPDLDGSYLYTDYNKAGLTRATLQPNGTLSISDLAGTYPLGPASITADSREELYLSTVSGAFYEMQAGP